MVQQAHLKRYIFKIGVWFSITSPPPFGQRPNFFPIFFATSPKKYIQEIRPRNVFKKIKGENLHYRNGPHSRKGG